VADRVLAWLVTLPVLPTYAVLAALSATENVFPPVPADVAVALGAFLSQRGAISAPLLGLLCWLANSASAAGVYALARAHGPRFFGEGLGRILVPPRALEAVESAFHAHGPWGIFATRFLPGVRAAVLPVAGVLRIPARRSLLPAITASAFWYAFLVAIGAGLGHNWDAVTALLGEVNRGLATLAIIACAAAALWIWRRPK
jgi:membrane protein DedA with SNARE-associated domain